MSNAEFNISSRESGKKILVVDDHQLFIDGILLALQSLDPELEPITANDATQALDYIEANSDLDLILADITMPGLDGIAFLKAMRNRRLMIPTAVVSGIEDITTISEALQSGALGFIPKSHNGSELVDAIRQVLKGELYLPSQLEKRLARLQNQPKPDITGNPTFKQFGISKRQFDVLELLSKGFSNKQIASQLYVSEHTVKSHVAKLFDLLEADNRTACIRNAEQRQIL